MIQSGHPSGLSQFPQTIEQLSTPILTGSTVNEPFVLEAWAQPDPIRLPIIFDEGFGGAIVDLANASYTVPNDAEEGAGFRTTDDIYPLSLRVTEALPSRPQHRHRPSLRLTGNVMMESFLGESVEINSDQS